MDGYVYSKTAPPAAVRALLTKPPARLDYIMQESASDIEFSRFTVPCEGWQPWETGRAFGREAEVRWQRLENGEFQLLVLSELPQPALENWPRPRVREAEAGGKIFLWGRERSFLTGATQPTAPPEWVQASIPRPLRYPLNDRKEFAYFEVVHYRQGGMIMLTRFCGLGGKNGEEVAR
jgi:hypothetical protein